MSIKKIGTVIAILNDELILIESSTHLSEGDRLIVFEEITSDKIRTQTSLEKVTISKGEIIIKSLQDKNIYLAATAIFESQRRTAFENPIGSALAVSLSGIGLRQKEVVESVPKTNPILVNKRQSLNIDINKEVSLGDAIAKKSGF